MEFSLLFIKGPKAAKLPCSVVTLENKLWYMAIVRADLVTVLCTRNWEVFSFFMAVHPMTVIVSIV